VSVYAQEVSILEGYFLKEFYCVMAFATVKSFNNELYFWTMILEHLPKTHVIMESFDAAIGLIHAQFVFIELKNHTHFYTYSPLSVKSLFCKALLTNLQN